MIELFMARILVVSEGTETRAALEAQKLQPHKTRSYKDPATKDLFEPEVRKGFGLRVLNDSRTAHPTLKQFRTFLTDPKSQAQQPESKSQSPSLKAVHSRAILGGSGA